MEATTKRKLTQEDCDTVRYLLKYGRTLKEIAEIIHVDPSTVGKIRLANYDLPTYLEQRKAMNRKTKENKRAALRKMEELENREQTMAGVKPESRWPKLSEIFPSVAEESAAEVPGQMKMDLETEKEEESEGLKKWQQVVVEGLAKQSSQNKFQAAMMDKLLKKLDELIDVLKGGERT